MIVLLVMTPEKQSGRAALLDFTDNDTGWDNTGITVLVCTTSCLMLRSPRPNRYTKPSQLDVLTLYLRSVK